MAHLNTLIMRRSFIKKAFLIVIVFIGIFLIGIFKWVFYGAPIHDFRLWVMEQYFANTTIQHPNNSVFLEKKTYLGGPDTHGSGTCVYAVGELRVAKLPEDIIRQEYQDIKVKKIPLKVFFTDGKDWPQESPFVNWQDELRDMSHANADNTLYIIYIATKYPFLGDLRCDD